MEYLTKEAREYCTEVLLRMEREEIVEILENQVCVACYDEETKYDLVPAMVDSIEAGDIDFDWSIGAAKGHSHYIYTFWLDIDEIWTKVKPTEDADAAAET